MDFRSEKVRAGTTISNLGPVLPLLTKGYVDQICLLLGCPELRGAAGRPRKEKKRELPALTKMQRVYVRELQAKHGDDFEVRCKSRLHHLYPCPRGQHELLITDFPPGRFPDGVRHLYEIISWYSNKGFEMGESGSGLVGSCVMLLRLILKHRLVPCCRRQGFPLPAPLFSL